MKTISPTKFFTIPELRPERTARELYLKYHGEKAETIAREIERGTLHEMEHTPFRYIARIIASHHLWEDLRYYHRKGV